MTTNRLDSPPMSDLTIGQLARGADVSVETIRYYERRELLPDPPRSPAGYRKYPAETVRRVRFIKRAQALGFTLSEIVELLALEVSADGSCGDVEAKAQRTIRRIEDKIAELDRMHSALKALTHSCRAGLPTGECPIIETLEGEAAPAG